MTPGENTRMKERKKEKRRRRKEEEKLVQLLFFFSSSSFFFFFLSFILVFSPGVICFFCQYKRNQKEKETPSSGFMILLVIDLTFVSLCVLLCKLIVVCLCCVCFCYVN